MSAPFRIWDAVPAADEQTHTLRLTVDSSRKWPFATGILAGFIIGFVLVMFGSIGVDEARVKRGTYYHDGKLYKLTEIKVD